MSTNYGYREVSHVQKIEVNLQFGIFNFSF